MSRRCGVDGKPQADFGRSILEPCIAIADLPFAPRDLGGHSHTLLTPELEIDHVLVCSTPQSYSWYMAVESHDDPCSTSRAVGEV